MTQAQRKPLPSPQCAELSGALASCRGAFVATGLISAMSNLLMLTGAMFMLQVYDRVLPSRSVPTLIGLAGLAAGLYAAQGLFDLIRGRILIGISLDEALSERVYHTVVRLPSIIGLRNEGAGPHKTGEGFSF
jgi:ABC-type protease/lipase transport system fused ATPase/permease subunit